VDEVFSYLKKRHLDMAFLEGANVLEYWRLSDCQDYFLLPFLFSKTSDHKRKAYLLIRKSFFSYLSLHNKLDVEISKEPIRYKGKLRRHGFFTSSFEGFSLRGNENSLCYFQSFIFDLKDRESLVKRHSSKEIKDLLMLSLDYSQKAARLEKIAASLNRKMMTKNLVQDHKIVSLSAANFSQEKLLLSSRKSSAFTQVERQIDRWKLKQQSRHTSKVFKRHVLKNLKAKKLKEAFPKEYFQLIQPILRARFYRVLKAYFPHLQSNRLLKKMICRLFLRSLLDFSRKSTEDMQEGIYKLFCMHLNRLKLCGFVKMSFEQQWRLLKVVSTVLEIDLLKPFIRSVNYLYKK
ncbi:MAG: hypothetical protein GWP59_03430, partial [Chlamydiales bacterium]|nr:hypothetical protein [Chlamydiales bacterium]